jgi:hypothetical protein
LPLTIIDFRLIDPIVCRFDLMFLPTGVMTCHDRNPVKEKPMSKNAIDSENNGKPAPDTAKPKGARKAENAKPAKKAGGAEKPLGSELGKRCSRFPRSLPCKSLPRPLAPQRNSHAVIVKLGLRPPC